MSNVLVCRFQQNLFTIMMIELTVVYVFVSEGKPHEQRRTAPFSARNTMMLKRPESNWIFYCTRRPM